MLSADPGFGLPLVLGGMLLTLALGFAIALKKTISVPLIVAYAAVEGVFVGAISNSTTTASGQRPRSARRSSPRCRVFAGMFIGLEDRASSRSPSSSRRIFGMAVMGYLIFALINLVAAFMGTGSGWGFGGSGMLGIGISLFAIGLASDSARDRLRHHRPGHRRGAPEKYSWLLGHGLIVTLVWLYLEILRLLGPACAD